MNKWMSKLLDEKKLVLINIPGSHDSTAYNLFWLGSVFAKCQDYDINTQLNMGVRFFDIRVVVKSNLCCYEENMFSSLICCHGICDCFHTDQNNKKKNLTYINVLNQIRKFLEENPSETVIIKTDSGRGDKIKNLQQALIIFDSVLGDISVEYNNKLTLGQIRGKVVSLLKLREDENNNEFSFKTKIEEGTDIIPIHGKYTNNNENYQEFKVEGDLKVIEIKELLEMYNYTFKEAEKFLKLPLNYETSCTGEFKKILPFPKIEADIVNKFLKEYNFIKGNYYGWISVDFIDKEITNRIIESNGIDLDINIDMDDN